ncbi:MAG: ABC transporter substrate-binding protein [Coriobacteriales bacterium]|jgi:peptide/nickel transport system substrate-binding protein
MTDRTLSRRSFIATGAALAGGVALASNAGLGLNASVAKAEGGTLTGACAYSSTNYSPVGSSSALILGAIWHVFEGLYEIDLHTYETYPALASGDPTKVSDTEYEVTLRDGAKFSDGTDVTAADVVNAFEKNIANDTYGAFLSFIDSVEAKDDKTVTFKLKYAFDTLLKGRLALVKIFPASLTDDQLSQSPIGTGPWMYSSIDGDDGGAIEFEPNPNYNGSHPAKADSMHWDVLLDGTSRTTALQEGTAMVMENVPDENAEMLQNSGATVDYVAGFNQPFLMFNTKKAPFDDVRVRQAFFYAINVDQLISNVMNGHASKVTSFLPESHANYHQASTVYTYDPDKAKELLKEAGQESIDITLKVNNNWVSTLSAQIKNDLDAVGINTTLQEEKINWSELAESDSELPYDVMLTPGDPTCFGNDPDLLMNWWYGDNVWTRGRSCWAGTDEWNQLQDLLQQAREATGDDQQQLWNKCFDIIAEQVPLYALFHRELATGYQADMIDGFKPISTTGLVFLDCAAK